MLEGEAISKGGEYVTRGGPKQKIVRGERRKRKRGGGGEGRRGGRKLTRHGLCGFVVAIPRVSGGQISHSPSYP
jgi:hypothetical protein